MEVLQDDALEIDMPGAQRRWTPQDCARTFWLTPESLVTITHRVLPAARIYFSELHLHHGPCGKKLIVDGIFCEGEICCGDCKELCPIVNWHWASSSNKAPKLGEAATSASLLAVLLPINKIMLERGPSVYFLVYWMKKSASLARRLEDVFAS